MHAEHNKVVQAALLDTSQRQLWVLTSVIILLLIGAYINWNQIGPLAPAPFAGANFVSWLNLGMAAWLLLVTGFIWHLRFVACKTHTVLLIIASFLLFGAVRSAIDQWGTASVTIFSLCCVFTGTLMLVRPIHAIVLFSSAYALFYYLLKLTQHNPLLLKLNQAQSFAAALLGLVLTIMLWRKHTLMTLLQQQLQASNDELQQQKLQLEILSQHDALTGLYNRREFDRLANIELLRAKREGSSTSVIMTDLDLFKRVNDNYGHPAGDEVIRLSAETLSNGLRGTDVVARIGGEEFIFLLPSTTLDEALNVAEKLRMSLLKNPIKIQNGHLIYMTASFGVTTLSQDQSGTLDALYIAADLALYAAKSLGRNRVETHPVN